MRTFETYIAQAAAAFDAGFASEAARKNALADLGRAYDRAREDFMHALIAEHPHVDGVGRGDLFETLYWGVPMYVHIWGPKQDALFAAYPDLLAKVAECRDLRAAIKAADVAPRPVRVDHPAAVRVQKTLAEMMAARNVSYIAAVDLGHVLGRLPVSCAGHYCRNEGGTTWVRVDYYLRGRRTAFAVIAAAYDALVRDGTIVEEE